MYPIIYKHRTSDLELIRAIKTLEENRSLRDETKRITKKMGKALPRKLKTQYGVYCKDGVIALTDKKLFVTYKPAYKTKRNHYDIEWKTKI